MKTLQLSRGFLKEEKKLVIILNFNKYNHFQDRVRTFLNRSTILIWALLEHPII
jgi:hypothetical protein